MVDRSSLTRASDLKKDKAASQHQANPYAQLYKVWCRLFFSDYDSQIATKPLESKTDKQLKLELHVPMLNMICADKSYAEIEKIFQGCTQSILIELAEARLIVRDQPKRMRLNPSFLADVEIQREELLKILLKMKEDSVDLLKKLGETGQEQATICERCRTLIPKEMIRQFVNCVYCEGPLTKRQYEPKKEKDKVIRCDYLLNNLDKFRLIKERIEKEIHSTKEKKDREEKEKKKEEIKMIKFNQVIEKVQQYNPPNLSAAQREELEKKTIADSGQSDLMWKKLKDEGQWMNKLHAIQKKRELKQTTSTTDKQPGVKTNISKSP